MNHLEIKQSDLIPRDEEFHTFIPMKIRKRSGRSEVVPPENVTQVLSEHARLPDTKLVEGLARAFHWQRLIDEGTVRSGIEIGRLEGLDQATVNECMRLTLIDPQIIESILKGTQPAGLNLHWLTKHTIPCLWDEQSEKFKAISNDLKDVSPIC